MSVLEIFEKVNLIMPLEQRRFFNYFADSVDELSAMYRGFVLEKDAVWQPPEALSDAVPVRSLYAGAIVDNILFLAGGEEARKSEFIRKSHEAYLKYWNDNAKGKKMKQTGWLYV